MESPKLIINTYTKGVDYASLNNIEFDNIKYELQFNGNYNAFLPIDTYVHSTYFIDTGMFYGRYNFVENLIIQEKTDDSYIETSDTPLKTPIYTFHYDFLDLLRFSTAVHLVENENPFKTV